MKFSRDYILKNAFKVFLNKGYDSTSITILQQELKMSRGALYRYFTNKEDLFISVIDEYFFKPLDTIGLHLSESKEYKLSEFIEVMHNIQKLFIQAFSNATNVTHTAFLNYTALLIQAAKHYPDFIFRFRNAKSKIRSSWKQAIINSIEAKEIRNDIDIDIMSGLFSSMTATEASEESLRENTFFTNMINNINERKIIMNYLFNLIKV